MGTLCTIPLLDALQATKSALVAFLLIAAAWLIVAGYTSINAVVKAELFPTKVRATGVGLPYAVTVSIFGGTAESIALWFKSIGHETWFYYYLTARDRDVAHRLRDDARHQASLRDGAARVNAAGEVSMSRATATGGSRRGCGLSRARVALASSS